MPAISWPRGTGGQDLGERTLVRWRRVHGPRSRLRRAERHRQSRRGLLTRLRSAIRSTSHGLAAIQLPRRRSDDVVVSRSGIASFRFASQWLERHAAALAADRPNNAEPPRCRLDGCGQPTLDPDLPSVWRGSATMTVGLNLLGGHPGTGTRDRKRDHHADRRKRVIEDVNLTVTLLLDGHDRRALWLHRHPAAEHDGCHWRASR